MIAGANGFLGRYITRYFHAKGWEVVGLARRTDGMDERCRYVHWDGRTLGDWSEEMEGCDVLINMAGRSVNCRYNDENKRQIMDSRVESTRVLGQAITACQNPPELWMNASTAALYKDAETQPKDETGEIGEGFSVEVAKAWEAEFYGVKVPGKVRKVALRTSLVMAKEPGTVYDYLLKLSKLFLGGSVGGGKQMVSWIYIEDYCRALEWLIEHDEISGAINMTAPDPITNGEMMRRFRKLAKRPFGLPATAWMAEIGAFLLRTETELILKSRWVLPTRLLANGFVFKHPEMKPEDW